MSATLSRGLKAEGFVVVAVDTGVEGLHEATENSFDVVVLDIMLPGHSGYEVLRRMRAQEVWTPVLMLTAKDGEYDETDAFDLGADDYLTKPFSFRGARSAHASAGPSRRTRATYGIDRRIAVTGSRSAHGPTWFDPNRSDSPRVWAA